MLQVLQILHYVDGIFTSRIAASFYWYSTKLQWLYTDSYTEIPLFVTWRKSSLYLCVIGISKRICIISQCKEIKMQNNKTDSKGPQEIQYSFRNILEHFKGKLLLIILYWIESVIIYVCRLFTVFNHKTQD